MIPQVDLFSFVFLKKLKTPKNISKITDLYENYVIKIIPLIHTLLDLLYFFPSAVIRYINGNKMLAIYAHTTICVLDYPPPEKRFLYTVFPAKP